VRVSVLVPSLSARGSKKKSANKWAVTVCLGLSTFKK
jgi:hypothetical protein